MRDFYTLKYISYPQTIRKYIFEVHRHITRKLSLDECILGTEVSNHMLQKLFHIDMCSKTGVPQLQELFLALGRSADYQTKTGVAKAKVAT